MKRYQRDFSIISILLSLFFLIQSCSSTNTPQPLKLNILHINDTHSHLEADTTGINMVFDGINAKTFLGGFARIKSAVDYMRNTRQNVLFVHAGDAVQGTLYFTKFQGDADIDFLNLIGIDVMTFGNHEFDNGTVVPKKLVNKAKFDIVSANIDFTMEPQLNEKVKPYVIKNYENSHVAIIGVTTEETVTTSSPGATVKFKNVIQSIKKTVAEIEAIGINKIIVLSHIGYDADKIIAQEVKGIDIIVGGHSHTLLGDEEYRQFGLTPEGNYPTVIKKDDGDVVLIVQAWKWGQAIGALMVNFDAKGKVERYNAEQLILVNERFVQNKQDIAPDSEVYKKIIASINSSKGLKLFPEDADALRMLAPLKAQIDNFRKQVLTVADDDLISGLNSGPGPLVIDSFVEKLKAEIGLINRGSIRKDLFAGNVTLGDVYEMMPFGNTLCLVNLRGSEIKQLLEDGIDYQLIHNPKDPYYPYVSGLKYSVRTNATKGNRLFNLMKKRPDGTFEPLKDDYVYKFVTNNFIAKQGGDGFVFFNTFQGSVIDTGLIDAEVFSAYLSSQRSIQNPKEERIKIDNSQLLVFIKRYIIISFYKDFVMGKNLKALATTRNLS